MSRVRSLAVMTSAIVGSAVLFGMAGYFGGSFAIDRQNRAQLRELTELVMRRAELQADFAFIALGDLVRASAAGCDSESLGRMRRQVYLRSTVKDIRVVDGPGRTLCAAFPETLDFDAVALDRSEASPARNTRVSLFRLDQHSIAALGVLWQVDPDLSLVAVLNTDALLFDVLPPELRSSSDLRLMLPTGDVVAAYSPEQAAESEPYESEVFEATSERYPLTARLAAGGQAFRSWNKGLEAYLLVGAALLGLAFGVLLGRVLVPRRTLLSEIDEALELGEFKPFAQPVFLLSTGAITGCEILARWIRPDGTIVSPYRFIPVAEETGRIVPLTHSLMREALGGLAPLLSHDQTFTIAFNVSPRHFLSDGFVEEICDLVAAANTGPGQVVLEITERQELPDLEKGTDRIRQLELCGIRVAIDDAGTGHNGLSHMQKLGAQILKIDKFFVDAIELDFSARVIVEMLVKVARELKMTTIAEGIERREQLAWLREIGVDEGQGFLMSPAVPLSDFVNFVNVGTSTPTTAASSSQFQRIA